MISIIIPCRTIQEAQVCQDKCKELKFKDIEVIVLPDSVTGKVSPAAKRNIGITLAKGEWVAFIDADAYPDPMWLNFQAPGMAGWCGPGVLPLDSPLMEKVSDIILKWLPFSYRVKPTKKSFYVTDYPTFNLILRKDIVVKLGGFKEDTLTGEDSDLCQRITDLGLKILYMPWCKVYHRRRASFIPFLKQIGTYALHRGFFFKKGIGNSRKLVYALPSLCLIFLLLLVTLWLF